MSLNTLKTVYYSYFNAIINYGLPFRGNWPHSIKIFEMQKRIIRIMISCKNRVSCSNLFRRLEIQPSASQYVLSPMVFVVKNKHRFTLNSENLTKSTKKFYNFYQPITIGFGGLEVACCPLVPKFAGSNPAKPSDF